MFLRNNTKTIDSSPDGNNWSAYIVKTAAATVHPIWAQGSGSIIQNNPTRPNSCDITIDTGAGTKLKFSLYEIQGQAGWITTSESGVLQAATDLTTWLNS